MKSDISGFHEDEQEIEGEEEAGLKDESGLVSAVVEKVNIDDIDNNYEKDSEDESSASDASRGSLNVKPETSGLVCNIEAVLFISTEPVSLEMLAEVTGADGNELAGAVEALRVKFAEGSSGIVFAEVAGGYAFRTSDHARAAVERFCERPAGYSLSPAAMETLAVVAYLQPVTRPEIARIRGVGADTVVNTLVDKGLLMEAGRGEHTGAIKYRTTAVFEKLFGLPGLAALPPIEGFEATPADVEELREKLHLAAEKRG